MLVILGNSSIEEGSDTGPLPDADNDGCPDTEDAFPDNPKECKDSDGDGVGDNSDVFPFDASISNSVVVNFSSGNVSSIVLNTDAVSLGLNANARYGRNDNGQGEDDNNNIIAYDENGNEVDNAVETSDDSLCRGVCAVSRREEPLSTYQPTLAASTEYTAGDL